MIWFPPKILFRQFLFWLAQKRKPSVAYILLPEDIESWQAFYKQDLELDEPFDLQQYYQMICRHGIPDFGNSYFENEIENFEFHPGGFLTQELLNVLNPPETYTQQLYADAAVDRVGLLLAMGCKFLCAQGHLKKDDIQYVCSLAILQGWYEPTGATAKVAIQTAANASLLPAGMLAGLYVSRSLMEYGRYPPYSEILWDKLRTLINPPKKAPKLDLSSWRGRVKLAKAQSVQNATGTPLQPEAPKDQEGTKQPPSTSGEVPVSTASAGPQSTPPVTPIDPSVPTSTFNNLTPPTGPSVPESATVVSSENPQEKL